MQIHGKEIRPQIIRITIVNTLYYTKPSYRFSLISIKIIMPFFTEIETHKSV